MALASQLEDEWQQYRSARDAAGASSSSGAGGALGAGSDPPPPPGTQSASPMGESDTTFGAPPPAPTAAVEWVPQGLPGVMEAVSMTYDLSSASAARSEQYVWFSSVVALDDSCGEDRFCWG